MISRGIDSRFQTTDKPRTAVFVPEHDFRFAWNGFQSWSFLQEPLASRHHSPVSGGSMILLRVLVLFLMVTSVTPAASAISLCVT